MFSGHYETPTPDMYKAALRDNECLRHDIERHIAMASELATENERLRAELASWQEAFGLLTTLHGSVQIDSSDPMGMAKQIESHVRAEARKPDCRTCFWHGHISEVCNRAGGAKKCGGVRYVSTTPVRLYEKDGK